MNTRPQKTRLASGPAPISHGSRSGLARLIGLIAHAVVTSVLLLYAAGCGRPEHVPVYHEIDSSDTRTRDLVMLSHQIDSLTRFADAIERVGVAQDLSGYGPWTVFAPVDRAFSRAAARLDTIRRAGLTDSLQKIVRYHVVRGRVDTSIVSNSRGDSLVMATVFEEPVTMHIRDGGVTVGNDRIRARVLEILEAENGILYIVNEVLVLPPPDTTAPTEILFF